MEAVTANDYRCGIFFGAVKWNVPQDLRSSTHGTRKVLQNIFLRTFQINLLKC